MFREALASALGTLRDACGAEVRYFHAGSEVQPPPVANIGKAKFPQNATSENQRAIVAGNYRDYLIAAAALVDDAGDAFQPTQGDTIVDGSQTWMVASLDGSRCFEWSDPSQTQYRIHTVEAPGD